jgi:hypothetical protein
MTLHLSPAERAAYDRERQRQHNAAYRERQATKAWLREERYRQIEERIAQVHEESEWIKSRNAMLEQENEELRNAPPKKRIVEVATIKEVPTLFHVGNIAAVMKLVIEAPPHWRQELWAELEPYMQPFVK